MLRQIFGACGCAHLFQVLRTGKQAPRDLPNRALYQGRILQRRDVPPYRQVKAFTDNIDEPVSQYFDNLHFRIAGKEDR
ncbi:hypothetical protein D3C81_2072340 [compost metagenome]